MDRPFRALRRVTMTKADAFGDAWATSMEYQIRYYGAGFLAIPLIMALFKLNPLEAAEAALLHSVAAPFVTFPGAMIVNYFALRMGHSPERSERRRTWTSAIMAVLLAWAGYSVLQFLPYPPPDLLVRTLG